MTLRDFIKANRDELEQQIANAISHVPATASCDCSLSGTEHHHAHGFITNAEIAEWVRNDESLYNWARSEGVRI